MLQQPPLTNDCAPLGDGELANLAVSVDNPAVEMTQTMAETRLSPAVGLVFVVLVPVVCNILAFWVIGRQSHGLNYVVAIPVSAGSAFLLAVLSGLRGERLQVVGLAASVVSMLLAIGITAYFVITGIPRL